jgi:TonB family protein
VRHGLASALALTAAAPLAAQQAPEPIIFAGDVFDVTGAGTLDLGDIDPLLMPHIAEFEARPIMTEIELDLTVDRAGTVLDCRAAASDGLAEAGEKLCVHAKAVGRFRADPFLQLDYTRASYRTSIRLRYYPTEGQSLFYPSSNEYPFLDDRPVIFGDGVIPPEDQSLAKTDVTIAPLEYPRQAARNEVMGRVEVSVTFDAKGKPESCRPIRSDFTARLAYETCEAARKAVRLNSPPDARPFVMKVYWRLN